MESPVMTIKEAADYLKISQSTLYLLVHSRTFPSIKIGNSWRILKKDLDVWLKKQLEDKPESI